MASNKNIFETVFENAAIGMARVAPDGSFLSVNQKICDIVGYTKDELLSLTFQDITHPDDLELDLDYVHQMLDGSIETYSMEKRYIKKDKSIIWVNLTVSLVVKKDGLPDYFISNVEDINERKFLEIELKNALQSSNEQELRKQLALQTGTIGIWEWSYDTNTLIWDDIMYEIYGFASAKDKRPYEMWSNAIDETDKPLVEKNLFSARETNGRYDIKFWITTPSLKRRYIHALGKNEFDENGNAYRMVGTNTDITEHKNLIDKALKQEKKYKSLMQLSSDGLFIMNLDGKLLEYSNEVKKLLGYSDEELKNLYVYDWAVDFTNEEVLDIVKNTPREASVFETKHRRKDGSIYLASISAVKITIEGEDYIYAAVRDITELKQKDEEFKSKLQKFVDTQNNIVVLTDGKQLEFSNKTFLDFFGYENIEAFKKDYNCIYERFIEKDGFFNLGLVKENESNWIESMLNLSGRARVVSILDKYSISHAFSVSINEFDNESYVISFADISDTMIEKSELAKEANVDTLTNVYNRLYFNKHIPCIIDENEKKNMQTGIVMFDIDTFKDVNDTYGHDVGDYVLETIASLVTKYTRYNDKIVRWGGEEFIVISELDKDDNLSNLAEHLRTIIERYNFKDVGTVTCSFGCAVHNKERDILDTIKEADENLYKAKDGGRNRVVY